MPPTSRPSTPPSRPPAPPRAAAAGLRPPPRDGAPLPCRDAHAASRALQGGGDRLHFGVVLQHELAHLAPPARLLVAAEGQRRVEHVVAVDPHRAGANPPR